MKQETSSGQLSGVVRRTSIAAVIAVLVGLALAPACGGGGGGGGTTTDAGPGGTMDAGSQALTDARILQILQSANTAEIALGQLAATKAYAPSTVAFANRMVTDHTAANARVQTIVNESGIEAEPSTQSQQIDTQARLMSVTLNGKTGLDFDKTYAQSQVIQHQQLLALINDQMLPVVQNAELKTELQGLVPTIQEHLTSAQTLLNELEAMPAPPTPSPADAGTPETPDAGATTP